MKVIELPEQLQEQARKINENFKKCIEKGILKIDYEVTKKYKHYEKGGELYPIVSIKYYTERAPRTEKDFKYKMICAGHTKTSVITMHIASQLQEIEREHYMLKNNKK